MKRILLPLAALAVGAICAALLLWLWAQDRDGARRHREIRAAQVAAAAPVTPAVGAASPDAFTRQLLAALEQFLTRADTRAKEGLLTLKDEAAYRRFLARAQKAGLTILGQLDALRAVRVRYDSFAALRADLLANADDYAGVSANYVMTIPGPPAKDDRSAIAAVPFGNRALEFLGVDPASAARATWGQGVTVAVLDTGIARDATFGDYRVRYLDIGLGTAVASLAAGAPPGASFNTSA